MVQIYTLPGCPKCEILKKKLTAAGISYENVTDKDEMTRLGIRSCPVLNNGESLLRFEDAVAWVNNGGR